MATNLTDIIKKVRTALRGEEVRGSIADGLEYCGQISENAKADMEATASAAKEAMNKTASDAKTAIETSAASTKEQLSKDIDAKAAAALKSIPESYTELDGSVKRLEEEVGNQIKSIQHLLLKNESISKNPGYICLRRAIRELYITGETEKTYYMGSVRAAEQIKEGYRWRIIITDGENNVCGVVQYVGKSPTDYPPQFFQLNSLNDSGITGIAVVNWGIFSDYGQSKIEFSGNAIQVINYNLENNPQVATYFEQIFQIKEIGKSEVSLKNKVFLFKQNSTKIYNNILLSKGAKIKLYTESSTRTTFVLCKSNYYDGKRQDNKILWDNAYGINSEIILDDTYGSVCIWNNGSTESIIRLSVLGQSDTVILSNPSGEIELSWYNGGFNDTRDERDVANTVRTQKIQGAALYLVCFPNELMCRYNVIQPKDQKRLNVDSPHPFSVLENDFFVASFTKKDNSELTAESEILKQVKIYKISRNSGEYDVTIAAYNSPESQKKKADIVCDGTIDTSILAAIFGCYHSIRALLYDGDYNIDEMWSNGTGAKCALSINYSGIDPQRRQITIEGLNPGVPQTEQHAKLHVTQKLHESLTEKNVNYFVIAIPYQYGEIISGFSTSISLSHISVIGYCYDKPITYVDLSRAMSAQLDNVNVRSWSKDLTSYDPFENTPNPECTGIRVGRGSNFGIQNYVKHSNIWYCGRGLACNGEHFVFEDVKTHHDYVGWYFGDRRTNGHMEHPNIMLGCSIEACYRTMILSKNGISEQQEFIPESGSANMYHSTLIAIGTSTETLWQIPTNERTDDGETGKATLPILEICYGAYRGRIEIDGYVYAFEQDGHSGINMEYTCYNRGDTWTKDKPHPGAIYPNRRK